MNSDSEIKTRLGEVMREFYEEGVPTDVKVRSVDYFEKLRAVTVVTGMRRTGKTYVTYQRMRELLASGIPLERIVHVNFDDDRLKGMRAEDLHLIGDLHAKMFPDAAARKCWYFLDELQDISGWELYARRLVDSPLVQLCLTGSSSKLLSSEIASELRGRSLETEVFPLSFPEFLNFNAILAKRPTEPYSSRMAGLLRKSAARYLDEGGFPDVQGDVARVRNKTLQDYVDAVVYRDVLERHEVPSVQALRYTLDYIIHNFARKVSTRAISGVLKALGVSDNREYIADYLGYFKDAYLIYPVSLRTDSLSVRRMNPDKYYIVDTGVIRAMTPKNEAERGWLLENLVFLSLRRGYNRIEYYNTARGGEVDFLVTDLGTKKRRLVQVAWELSGKETLEREVQALLDAQKETKADDLTIVTWDEEAMREDGIRVVPAWKWLLREVEVDNGRFSCREEL